MPSPFTYLVALGQKEKREEKGRGHVVNCPAPRAGEGGRAGQEKHEPGAAKQGDPGRLGSVSPGSSKQGDPPLLEVETEELGRTQESLTPPGSSFIHPTKVYYSPTMFQALCWVVGKNAEENRQQPPALLELTAEQGDGQ